MTSNITPVVQQTAPSDSTQRIATKTRIGVSSLVGGATLLGSAAAVAHFSIGIPAVASAVEDFLKNYFTLPNVTSGLSSVSYLNSLVGQEVAIALGAATVATGAVVGGAVGKMTAHQVSLNDVKERLGVAGSDLNFSQMHRVADIAVNGGIFSDRSTSVQFKEDAVRIRNLNSALTNTEFSLSSNAHNTSKARGVEDRLFDLEGGRLASLSHSSGEFIQTIATLKSAIFGEVKATDKYTYQQGNSSTSVNRRDYILAGIMGHAHERGIAGAFLTAAIKERLETAQTNPKLAEANFRQALQDGISSGILAPDVDAKCYDGMVNAAAVASMASTGKNPDAVISSIFDAFKGANLIDANLRARFIKDVREKMSNPEAEISEPVTGRQSTFGSALIEKLLGFGSSVSEKQKLSSSEDGLDVPAVLTEKEIKARMAAEAEAQANSDVNLYSDTLASMDPRQKELADLYEKLISLLNEKSEPLDKIMAMGPRRLRGAIAMRHKQGFDLFDKYEANDGLIAQTREQIAALRDAIDSSRSPRPENFRLASREQKKAAEALEKQVKSEDARIVGLKAKSERIAAKIGDAEGQLDDNEGRATTYLFPATEIALEAPVVPEEPGFFARLFGSSSKVAEESAQVDGEVAVEIEQGLSQPDTAKEEVKASVTEELLPEPTQTVGDDVLPEPVIENAKPSWKIW